MSGLKLKYFVLKPHSNAHNDLYACASRIAIRAYADAIMVTNPVLASELQTWANKEMNCVPEIKTYRDDQDWLQTKEI